MVSFSTFHMREFFKKLLAFIKRIAVRFMHFAKHHQWRIALIIAAVSVFYWYEVRPIIVFRQCAKQSSVDAFMLLNSKAAIAKDTPQGKAYAKLLQNRLYLRADYESFLMKCLTYQGLQIEPLDSKKLVNDRAVPVQPAASSVRSK